MTFINKHLEHVEDSFLGTQEQIDHAAHFLIHYPNNEDNEFKTTLKWDGGLSIVFGIKPGTEDTFIIGTKGVFNKTPKFALNKSEIHDLYKPPVAAILDAMFDELKNVVKEYPGLYQGDVMWDPTTVKNRKFKPNTLEYSFSKAADSAFIFRHFKHAIAVHTVYSGKSFKTLSGKPFQPENTWNALNAVAKIFYIEPVTIDGVMVKAFQPLYYLGIVHLHEKMYKFGDIDLNYTKILKRYINYQIKKYGVEYTENIPDLLELRLFLETVNSGHSRGLLDKLYTSPQVQIEIMSRLEAVVITTILKTALIEMLNAPTRQYRIQVEGGEHEGFVVHHEQYTYKLINRHNFSYQNFKEHDEVING